jgi:ABC-2 type transport system permease protein
MARLATATPTARDHIAAIAQLRWRLFINAFRGRRGKTKLITRIIAGIILYPIAIAVSIGPIVGSGFGGYTAIAESRPILLTTILWILSIIWCFITFSVSLQSVLQAGSFDLSQLIRFPIRFSFYLTARLFFSFFSYTTIVGFLSLLAMAIGIGIADHSLFVWAALTLLLYALLLFFFLKMIFLWLDRWLAQRRTREIAAALFAVFTLSIQFFSATIRHQTATTHSFNHKEIATISHTVELTQPIAALLPPNLATRAIQRMHAGQPTSAIPNLLGVAAWGAAFLALYAIRLRGEFRGENFSEAAARGTRTPAGKRSLGWNFSNLSPAITACIEKEVRYLLRGSGTLVSYITPLFFSAIIVSRMGKTSSITLPAALAYVLLALFTSLYNVFGADGPGINLYLLAPVRLRDVILAKNLVSSTLVAIEVTVATLIVTFFHRTPIYILAATLLWVVFALFANLSLGNIRSLRSPHRVVIGRSVRQPTSRSGVFLTLIVLFSSLGLCMGVLWICNRFGHPWLPTLLFLLLAATTFGIYITVLNRIDRIAIMERDTLIEELVKT